VSARWERTPDRATWRAASGGRLLTVSKLSNGKWRGTVEDARSPELATRLVAQRWAEHRAGGTE